MGKLQRAQTRSPLFLVAVGNTPKQTCHPGFGVTKSDSGLLRYQHLGLLKPDNSGHAPALGFPSLFGVPIFAPTVCGLLMPRCFFGFPGSSRDPLNYLLT